MSKATRKYLVRVGEMADEFIDLVRAKAPTRREAIRVGDHTFYVDPLLPRVSHRLKVVTCKACGRDVSLMWTRARYAYLAQHMIRPTTERKRGRNGLTIKEPCPRDQGWEITQ